MAKENNDIHAHDGRTAAEMLKTARTAGRRKRELGTIARQLCIKEEFLEALEDGDYAKIPELVYIFGFARNYAVELELDPDTIIQKIKREMGLLEDNDEVPELPKHPAAPAEPSQPSRAAEMAKTYVLRYWKWLASAIILIAAVIVAATVKLDMPKRAEQSKLEKAPAEQALVAPAPSYKLPIREQLGTENKAAATVVLQAVAETWLKVEDSRGETLFSRVLSPGDIYYVPAAAGVKATVGNAGGLDVYVGGKLAPKLGPDHTRKSGVSLAPAALMPEPAAAE